MPLLIIIKKESNKEEAKEAKAKPK